MNDKKKIIMGFRLKCGQAILENGDQLTIMDDPAALAQHYSDQGADHLYIRDLSETDAAVSYTHLTLPTIYSV